jgi:hypothetical protein
MSISNYAENKLLDTLRNESFAVTTAYVKLHSRMDERGRYRDVQPLVVVGQLNRRQLLVEGRVVVFCCCHGWRYFSDHFADSDPRLRVR